MPTGGSGSLLASPLDGWASPPMIFSSVDLPVPFGPTTPILAPCRKERVTLSRTTLSPWALRTLRSVNTYSAMIGNPTAAATNPSNRRSCHLARGRFVGRRPPLPEAVELGQFYTRLGQHGLDSGVDRVVSVDPFGLHGLYELCRATGEGVPDVESLDHVGHGRGTVLTLPHVRA